jgi:hypothetical protein
MSVIIIKLKMKLHNRITTLFLMLFGLGLFITCDAPRHNPLDPDNPDNNLAFLSGQIETLSHLPVSKANVYWPNDNCYLETDNQGYFKIDNILPEDGWIYFSKKGFLDDSMYIEWDKDLHQNWNIKLNSKPLLDSVLIYSTIQNDQNNIQTLTIGVETIINDPDNDIDTVFVENPDFNFRNYLQFDFNKQMHRRIFSPSQLGFPSPGTVIGHELFIIVKDKFNHLINLDKTGIKRIITEPITDETERSPVKDTVSSSPKLEWKSINPKYPLTFDVEIYDNNDNRNVIWHKQGVLQSTVTVQFHSVQVDHLPVGSGYSWTIWYTDNFHNRSRSLIQYFNVE